MLKKLASQTAVYGLGSILGRMLNWGLTPLYTNVFSPEDFGQYSFLYALCFFGVILLTFGMETSYFHYAGRKLNAEQAYANAFHSVAAVVLLFMAMVVVMRLRLSEWLAIPPHLILQTGGIIALDALAALPLARLRYSERPARFTLISLFNIGLTIVLNIILIAILRLDVSFVFTANVIASGVRFVMAMQGNVPKATITDWQTIRAMLGYGFFIMLAGLTGAINETLDRILLPELWPEGGKFRGKVYSAQALNGIYNANYKLGMFIALVTQAFRYAAEPFFFRKADEQGSPAHFARVFHYFMLLNLGMMLLISSFAYELVSFNLFGLLDFTLIAKAYWVGLEVVPIILFANVALGAYLNLAIWFKLTGKLRMGLLISAIGAAITIGLNVWFIPYYGFIACAWATLTCYVVMAVLCYITGQYYYPIPYRLDRLIFYSFIFTVLSFVNAKLYIDGHITFGFTVIKFVLCCGALGVAFLWEKFYPIQFFSIK